MRTILSNSREPCKHEIIVRDQHCFTSLVLWLYFDLLKHYFKFLFFKTNGLEEHSSTPPQMVSKQFFIKLTNELDQFISSIDQLFKNRNTTLYNTLRNLAKQNNNDTISINLCNYYRANTLQTHVDILANETNSLAETSNVQYVLHTIHFITQNKHLKR